MYKTLSLGAVTLALITLMSATGAGAEEYAKGHGALEVFDPEGIANSPQWVQIWIFYIMLPAFALGLLFVWTKPIARWVVGGILASLFLGELPFAALGLPYLSGAIALAHIVCWSPALYFLLTQRPFLTASEPAESRFVGLYRGAYRAWTGLITFVILFSFVFDIRDAAIYIDHMAGIGILS